MSQAEYHSSCNEPSSELRALFITVRDLVLLIGSNGDTVDISPADKVQRFTPIPLLGKTLDEVLSPFEAMFFRTHVRRAIQEGEEHQVEYPLRVGEERRWFAARVAPVTNDTVLWIAQDITRSKRAEEELRHQLRLTQAITKSLGEGVYALDEHGLLIFMNPAAEQALGWKEDELRGREIHDLIHYLRPDGSRRPAHECPLLQVLQTGEITKLDIDVLVRRNGSLIPVSYTASPLITNGTVMGAVLVFRDITRQKALEEQLCQARKMELVGELAAGMAHDFNNLLTIIDGLAARLLDQPALSEQSEKEFRAILGAGERAAALTQRLLAFSYPQSLEPRELSLNKVVEGLDPMLRRLLAEDIQLTVRLARESCYLNADQAQLEQAIVNLVVNARDAMRHGGELEIRTALVSLGRSNPDLRPGAKPGTYVVLAIQDSGCGIESADLNRIFEPFFTTKKAGRGTGLGLSIVYRFVEQNGGYMRVESTPGQGALFVIYLPACLESSAKPSAGHGHAANLNRKETILLVDDDSCARVYVEIVLKDLGYTVLSVSDGRQALETLKTHTGNIDLLLTDKMLPDQSGSNLAEKLSLARPQMKVLFMSGYLDANKLNLLPGAGAAVLVKPFSAEILASTLRDVLDTRSSAQPKLLIADDDPSIRAYLARVLEHAGFDTLEARDGSEILKQCAENEISVVITDLAMPAQEGLETIGELRRGFPKVKIIAISGFFASTSSLAAARHLGACAVFPKPVDIKTLIDTVRQLTSR